MWVSLKSLSPIIRMQISPLNKVNIAILLTLLYLSTLTADYYWDGITFALQIEKVAKMERGASLLFHQNHLLYNVIGFVAYDLLRALSIPVRALFILQTSNAFVGAAAIGVFFRLAVTVSRCRYAAVISSAAFASAAVWWKLATDANAYVMSILLLLVCASTLLSAKPRWFLAAAAFAGGMLIHQLASPFYLAALVAVFTNPSVEKKWKFVAKFSALAWGATIAAYFLCAALLHDIKAPLAVVKWAVSNPSGVSTSGNPLHGLALLPRGNLDMIVGHSFGLYRSQGGWLEKVLALATLGSAILCLVMFLRRARFADFLRSLFTIAPSARERWSACVPMLITWIATYLVFLLFWEPWQVLYRAFYLPPLALMLALVLSNYHNSTRALPTGAAAGAVVTLALFNLTFFVLPHTHAAANPLVAAARSAHHLWDGKTVVYFADRNEADTAFEYFNDQTEWRRFSAVVQINIDDEIQRASSQGGQVWLNKGAAELVDQGWLSKRARGREITLETANPPAHYVELLPY